MASLVSIEQDMSCSFVSTFCIHSLRLAAAVQSRRSLRYCSSKEQESGLVFFSRNVLSFSPTGPSLNESINRFEQPQSTNASHDPNPRLIHSLLFPKRRRERLTEQVMT